MADGLDPDLDLDLDLDLDADGAGGIVVDSVVAGPLETNVYFAISGSSAVAIDPSWDGAALTAWFASRHPGVRIEAVACTHGHADHVGGVRELIDALGGGIPFLLPRLDAPLVDGSISHQRRVWGLDTPRPGTPDGLLDEGDRIACGDAALQVVAAPGHTPGGIVLVSATASGPVAFVGDTLFPGSHGRTDLEGGDEGQIVRTLARLGALLPPETVCLTGHGPSTTIARELAQNPFMAGGPGC